MIRISLHLARNGCLQSLESSGHASDGSGDAGRNVACTGVSTLLRSVGRLLAGQRGVRIEGSADGPGFFQLRITRIALRKRRYVQGVTGILLQGLYDIRDDYPGELEIRELSEGELEYGT